MQSIFLCFDMQALTNYKIADKGKELTMSVNDAIVLDYIIRAFPSNRLQHIKDDGNSYVWLQHQHIIDDLPILNISVPRLKQILSKLKNMNLIAVKNFANKKAKGSRAYYRITENCLDLIYNEKLKDYYLNNVFTSKNFNVKEESSKNSYTSNNILINNNILDKSKDLCNTQNCEQSNSEQHCTDITQSNNVNSFLGSSKKKKKKALSIQWKEIIDSFTDNKELKDTIWEYISMYNTVMQDKNKPLYANVLKGKLNELNRMSEDVSKQIKILLYSISNGWITLYDVTKPSDKHNSSYRKSTPADDCGESSKLERINKTRVTEARKDIDTNGKSTVF